jgi:hypothetical protein
MNIESEFKLDHFVDLVIKGMIILKLTFKETEYECNDWIHPSQDTGYW